MSTQRMFLRSVGTPFWAAGMRAGLVILAVMAGLLLSLASTAMAQSVPGYTVTTFATGITGARGISTDAAGNVYTMGRDDGKVYKISPAGAVTVIADLPDLHRIGPHFDRVSGNLFISDANLNSAILKITPAGVVSVYATGLPAPADITSDAAGNLYVSNWQSVGTVSRVTPSGAVSQFATGLSLPDGLVFGPGGDLFVGNRGTNQIMRVPAAGGTATVFASGFNLPLGITSDSQGNLYVANFGNGVLSKVSPTGAVSTFGSGFSNPLGLAFDSNGNLFVANFGNGTISKISAVSPPVNHPPVLTVPLPQTIDEGQALTFNVSATDPDAGQTVTVTMDASGLPAGHGATFSGGTFSWRPTYNESGTYTVNFTATDNGSPVKSDGPKAVTITVNNVPAIPAPAGLVSLWSAENNANDSADGNNGTLQGGATFASGMIGQAFSFDGTSKYVGVTSPVNIPVGNSAYAIAAWIKPQSNSVFGIVGWGNYGTLNQVNAFRLNTDGNLINYWWANDLYAPPGVNLADGQFHHVVAEFDGTIRSIWVDGVQRGSDTPSGHNVPNAGNFRIGSTNLGEYFNGLVDEVAIFNRGLTASEIQAIYASGGLILNRPPSLSVPGPQTVNESQSLSFGVTATDLDAGQTTTITASGLPSGATFNGTTFSWTPALDQSGSYTVSFTATDNGTPPKSDGPKTVQITVNDIGPISPLIGPVTLRPGFPDPAGRIVPFDTSQDQAFQGNGFARPAVVRDNIGYNPIDRAEYINDGYYGNGSGWISYYNPNGWLKIDLGREVLIDKVRFGRDRTGGYDDRDPGQFTIQVALSDNVYATGDDSNDSNEYNQVFNSATSGFSGTINGPQTVQASFTPVVARFIKLTVASAGAAIDEVEVSGIPLNPPVLTVPGPQTVNEGQALSFNVSATDPDAGQSVTITATGLPSGATFANGAFSWRPTYNQSGTYTVNFTATDNGSPAKSDGPKAVQITVNNIPAIPAPAGLVSLWSAENNPNDTADGNHGTLQGGATFASGMVGQAFSLTGGAYLNVPDNNNLDLTTAITFAAWVNPGNSAGEMPLVDKSQSNDNDTNYRFLVKNAGHNPGTFTGNPPWQAYLSPATLPTGQWSHVAITLGGGAVAFYVNGVATGYSIVFANTPVPALHGANNGPLRIGRDIVGRIFQGSLDEVQLYNRVLPASEIQAIYASGGLIPNQPPVANAGADLTVECTGPSGASVTLNGAGSSDPNGDTLTYSWSGPFGTASGPTPTVTLPLGTHTITLTVNDGKGGTSSDTVQITVQDTTPPTLSGVPADATVECDAVPAPATVTATDACDPAPTVTFSETRTDGSSPDNYTLTRKWTATDHSNKSASATQTLTVRDTKAPTLSGVPSDATVECDAVPAPATTVTATDACDPAPTVTFSETRTDGSSPDNYTLTRKWTATDRSGNSASATQTLTVQDTTRPVITLVGVNPVTVECPTPYVDLGVRVTDNCDPNPTLTTQNPVNVHAPGDYTITYTARDRSGNTATLTRTVKVQDTTPPEAKAALTWVKVLDKDKDDDGKEDGEDYTGNGYKVSVSATDICDLTPVITAFIPQPLTAGSAFSVKYEKGKKNAIEVHIEKKKTEVKLKGPNEQALRALLAQAIALSGFGVTDGQVVSLISKPLKKEDDKSDEASYLFRFDGVLKLTSASGPGIRLVAFAVDASGNRSTTVEVLPVKSKEKKGQALLAKVGESDVPAPEALPQAFGLDSNYPNPFNPATTIRYALPEAFNVSLVVYNLLGQQVRTLVSGAQGPGYHTAVWDGRDEAGRLAATGMYIYRLQAGAFSQVRKMLFAK